MGATVLYIPNVMDPTTPHNQKEDFRTFITRVNVEFDLDIPLPGIESPSAREKDTSLPSQIYKHIRPLFFNKRVDKRSLLNNLEEWVHGNLTPTRGSFHVQSPAHQTEAERRAKQRHSSEEPPLRLKLTRLQKDKCMQQLLSLMKDEEYFLANGRVYDTKKRLAVHSFGDAKGLSPKKRRLDDEEDEHFHTAPNAPEKGYLLAQSPLAKNGDGNVQSPEMLQAAFQGHRRNSGVVNSSANQRKTQSPA